MTPKMEKLLSELWEDSYAEVFFEELPSARALHKRGLLDLRKTECNGEPMWEAKVVAIDE